MSKDFGTQPFRSLGLRLSSLRQKLEESLDDVSGAIEVEQDTLRRIEAGQERPSEDALLLLINHFEVDDDDAMVLWELAGYQNPDHAEEVVGIESMLSKQPVLMLMAMDSRIMYTDGLHIAANSDGVVLNFTQSGSQTATGQPLTVARVGMSPSQAHSMLQSLGQSLAVLQRSTVPKSLPAPDNHRPKKSNN